LKCCISCLLVYHLIMSNSLNWYNFTFSYFACIKVQIVELNPRASQVQVHKLNKYSSCVCTHLGGEWSIIWIFETNFISMSIMCVVSNLKRIFGQRQSLPLQIWWVSKIPCSNKCSFYTFHKRMSFSCICYFNAIKHW
jgi:hypothetical protein